MGRAKMVVSLEILRRQLELPDGVDVVAVENDDASCCAVLTIDGVGVPDAEKVLAVYSHKPTLPAFDRFEIVEP